MTNETTTRFALGAFAVFVTALTIGCGGAPGNEGDDMPTIEPKPSIIGEYPEPLDPSLPPMGEDPGNPSHGPVQPSEDE